MKVPTLQETNISHLWKFGKSSTRKCLGKIIDSKVSWNVSSRMFPGCSVVTGGLKRGNLQFFGGNSSIITMAPAWEWSAIWPAIVARGRVVKVLRQKGGEGF